MITPEQREALVRAIESGQPLNQAAKSLGIPRSSLYAERSRDAAFARQLAEARDASRSEPASGATLTPYDTPDGLSREQIGLFVRALNKTASVQKAAKAAGVNLHPRAIAPKDVPPEARRLIRDALDLIEESKAEPPVSPEQQLLSRWLSGAEFCASDLALVDVDKLRALSARAADSFESWRDARAQVLARHQAEGRRRRTDDSDWEAF